MPRSRAPELVVESVFVGRDRQLDQLDGYLRLALDGQGQIAFIAGEPGAGKTSLVRAFARQAQEAHSDLVVAVGECNAQTGYYGTIEVRLDVSDRPEADQETIDFVQGYIERVYSPHELGPEFQSLIVQRTEGNPLFTVELGAKQDVQEARAVAARLVR